MATAKMAGLGERGAGQHSWNDASKRTQKLDQRGGEAGKANGRRQGRPTLCRIDKASKRG